MFSPSFYFFKGVFILEITQDLIHWYRDFSRPLPFRESPTPYSIWISEIMAQQTQIHTLLPYYQRFVAQFPSVFDLAKADESEVLKLWEGLGYYSRAKNLHKAAKIVVSSYHGQLPQNEKELLALPGIGPYTAGAILSIAFGLPFAAVDGNVLRVITRLFNWEDDISLAKTKKKVGNAVVSMMDNDPGMLNEALMELGALVCTPKNPSCPTCPIHCHCLGLKHNQVANLPQKSKSVTKKRMAMEVGIIMTNDHRIYIEKRGTKGLLSGLWGFPIYEKQGAIPEAELYHQLNSTFPALTKGEYLGKTTHVFTHIIWDMDVYVYHLSPYMAENTPAYGESSNSAFVTYEALSNDYTLPVAFSKLLTFI